MSSFQKLLAEAYLLRTSNRTICSSETAWLRIFYLLGESHVDPAYHIENWPIRESHVNATH